MIHTLIETEIGCLRGRDAIYLDEMNYSENVLTLTGECNGRLTSSPREEWIGYTLSFHGILNFTVTELDLWEPGEVWPISSFFERVDSPWLKIQDLKVTPSHRHFICMTYDDVVEVFATGYQFRVVSVRSYP